MAKLQPCERTINFSLPDGLSVLDASWLLAQQNRRSYRQGMEYAFNNLEIFQTQTAQGGLVFVYVVPRTWVSANSWVKAYTVWRAQRHEVMEDSSTWSRQAKYADFKIYMNAGHLDGELDGTPVTVIEKPNDFLTLTEATALDANAMVEWAYSTFVVPNLASQPGVTEEYYGIFCGPDTNLGKGLIQNYAESRARPFPLDPSNVEFGSATQPQGGLYVEMQNVGDDIDEIMEGITDQNDSPPYIVGGTDSAYEFYPWGSQQGSEKGLLEDTLIIRPNTALAVDSTGPFTAYCGLLFFSNGTGESLQASLEFAAGNYGGVMARPMRDVN